MHKNTKLLPYMRRAIYASWIEGSKITDLAKEYKVSRPTVYKVVRRARLKDFNNHSSCNLRFRALKYGLKKLSLAERKLQKRIDRQNIKRYEKKIPGEMVHFDTKRLPLLKGEAKRDKREHLHVAIDDYSRYLTADIFPDKSQYSSAIHLQEVIREAPFAVESVYSDNGSAYKGRKDHAFVAKCIENRIGQGYTRPRRPQTNGKAERVIRTLMEEWHSKLKLGHSRTDREERRKSLQKYVHYYNTKRKHSAIGNTTPMERITSYYADRITFKSVNNALQSYSYIASIPLRASS
jgi:transposase InsO family protein